MQKNIKQFLINVGLLLVGILFFTLPQPNLFSVNGIPFVVFFSLVPIFILVRRVSWKSIWGYGFLYGFGCYCLYTYWLSSFHPMGITVIAALYGFYLMLALPCIKAGYVLFSKHGWIMQWVVWCGYEYIKTIGFSGFHYGVTGYTQWQNPILIQCTDLVGIWGLSALVTFPSCFIAEIICGSLNEKISSFADFAKKMFLQAKKHIISGCVWLLFLVFAIVYGFVSPVDYSDAPKAKIALVQPNNDPWRGGIAAYSANLDLLISLSNKALKEDSEIDLVVWPETAFVPRIEWHYKYRQDREKFELVEKLLNYLNNAPVPFLIGNDHAVMGYSRLGEYGDIDYNAALLFTPGVNCVPPEPEKYMKMHLVPFTEYFPFEKLFPSLYEALLNGDTHMWEKGSDPVVFDLNGLKFSTPICFEDTFGYIGRLFVNNGANAFVNISNDAWSKSLACQYQHLSMAVFRCVENRVPAVRATASGQTVVVDMNGKVLSMAEPFTENYLIGELPIVSAKKTLYTKWGDYVGIIFAVLAIGFLIYGLVRKIIKRGK